MTDDYAQIPVHGRHLGWAQSSLSQMGVPFSLGGRNGSVYIIIVPMPMAPMVQQQHGGSVQMAAPGGSMNDLQELIEIVRASRERTNGVFPLPDTPGCVDYAICEAAEALDAILRKWRAGDKRNNDRQPDLRQEWGQCGYMIASALMQTDYDLEARRDPDSTIYHVFRLLAREAVEMDGSLVEAFAAWCVYCEWQSWNPAELLHEICVEFEEKHLR